MDIDKIYELIGTKLVMWVRDFVRMLPNLVIAALVLVLGIYLARLLRTFASRLFTRIPHHQVLNALFASFIYIVGVGITIFTALSILKLDKAVTSLLAGAGIVGIALAFAFQDIAANFVAGIVMSFTRPIQPGNLVRVKDYMGTVEEIRLRDSLIRTFQGQLVFIPNKDIFQNPIENFTKVGRRRMDLVVGVSYGDDLEHVKQVALAAIEGVKGRQDDSPVEFYFEEFADSSINFSLRIWLSSTTQPDYLEARSEAIMRLKTAFDSAGITIPFPIRTLDFGVKGGERLFDSSVKIQNQ